MRGFPLIVTMLLALAFTPQSAVADIGCEGSQCEHGYWWVEIAGGGNCYVKFQGEREANFSGRYFSPMLAYIAIARKPACYRTAEWLMQYRYIRRALD